MFTKCGGAYAYLYLVLIVFFLFLNPRLLSVVITGGTGYVLLAALLSLLVLSRCLCADSWATEGVITAFAGFSLIYAVFLASIGLVYAMGWLGVDAGLVVNAEGWLASKVLRQTMLFEFIYLFFPFMLLGQYVLLWRIDLVLVIRWFTVIWLSGACVIFYQKFIDPVFFSMPIRWMWSDRLSGLSSDPNSFALISFLMMALVFIGFKIERVKLLSTLYIFILLVAAISEWFTGNRTSFAGIVMFMMAIPAIFSIACSDWTMKKRVLVGLLPLAPLIIAVLFYPMLFDALREGGRTGERLMHAWSNFGQSGFSTLLAGDARGSLFHVAWLLIMGAAWSGWGPGGFYREYSNIMYDQTGQVHKAFDSPLNHYLMIGCDFGIPVLIMNIIILLFPLFIGVQFLRKVKLVNERFVVATLLVSNVIFLLMINAVPPSYFLEVMWAWTAQLAILLVLGVRHQVFNLYLPARVVKGVLVVFSLLLIVVLFHAGEIATGFGQRVYHP